MSESDRAATEAETERFERMVTAILMLNPRDQAVAAEGLEPGEERILRAGSSIISAFFVQLGRQFNQPPVELWRVHMAATLNAREKRKASSD